MLYLSTDSSRRQLGVRKIVNPLKSDSGQKNFRSVESRHARQCLESHIVPLLNGSIPILTRFNFQCRKCESLAIVLDPLFVQMAAQKFHLAAKPAIVFSCFSCLQA